MSAPSGATPPQVAPDRRQPADTDLLSRSTIGSTCLFAYSPGICGFGKNFLAGRAKTASFPPRWPTNTKSVEIEDRAPPSVLVHRDDRLGRLHPGPMLDGARRFRRRCRAAGRRSCRSARPATGAGILNPRRPPPGRHRPQHRGSRPGARRRPCSRPNQPHAHRRPDDRTFGELPGVRPSPPPPGRQSLANMRARGELDDNRHLRTCRRAQPLAASRSAAPPRSGCRW